MSIFQGGGFHFKVFLVALKGEAFPSKGDRQGFQHARHLLAMHGFDALRDLSKRHGLRARNLHWRGDHGLGQRSATTAVMAAHQTPHSIVAPCVRPVGNALPAHTELFGNHLGPDPAPEHQQAGRSRAGVPMFVIGRQLLQRRFLGLTQFYNTLHQLPRHHEDARVVKFKSINQEHITHIDFSRSTANEEPGIEGAPSSAAHAALILLQG
jgi:hypothetical protein